jgi:branched-chain amino acid transport system permease protein
MEQPARVRAPTTKRSEEASVAVVDRQLQVYADWDAKQRERIKALITDELIEEHRAKPLGQHSDALERVLNYFRRQPLPGKYVIVATEPWKEYKLGVLSGVRGKTAEILDDETFATEEEAMHGVFLRRVRDLRGA